MDHLLPQTGESAKELVVLALDWGDLAIHSGVLISRGSPLQR